VGGKGKRLLRVTSYKYRVLGVGCWGVLRNVGRVE